MIRYSILLVACGVCFGLVVRCCVYVFSYVYVLNVYLVEKAQ